MDILYPASDLIYSYVNAKGADNYGVKRWISAKIWILWVCVI